MSNITSKGQVTLPRRMRDATGLKPGRAVDFALNANGGVVVTPRVKPRKSDIARRIEKVRGSLKLGMSTDEFMILLRGE
jgi:AbrB family looped-hinge helix DNA binding protein